GGRLHAGDAEARPQLGGVEQVPFAKSNEAERLAPLGDEVAEALDELLKIFYVSDLFHQAGLLDGVGEALESLVIDEVGNAVCGVVQDLFVGRLTAGPPDGPAIENDDVEVGRGGSHNAAPVIALVTVGPGVRMK